MRDLMARREMMKKKAREREFAESLFVRRESTPVRFVNGVMTTKHSNTRLFVRRGSTRVR